MEHDLVLALAFTNFDPAVDDLTKFIGDKWGLKFQRVLGNGTAATGYRARLIEVVERWRNPYAHGGFEKGHDATIYLQVPEVGAVPVGLTEVRNSPHFSLFPASETDIGDVFALLDEIDAWLEAELPHAVAWMKSGLPVRFDGDFRLTATKARAAGQFEDLLERTVLMDERATNMDY